MLSRRFVVKLFGFLSFFAAFSPRRAVGQIFFRPKRKELPRGGPNRFLDEAGNTLVGVVGGGGDDPERMVRGAVALIGGFEKLDLKGKTVLVKPNVVNREPNPSTTNPAVVAAVVKILKEEGARRVVVGDMSALATLSTRRNMKRTGITDAARAAGAEVIIFENSGWVEVPLEGATHVKKAYVTEWLYDVDLVINLPVIKTHRSASYTICLKNFIGCTHLKQRPYLIDSDYWEEIVAEFNLAYRPELNIVDGRVSMVSGGPWKGEAEKTDLIIASGDRVAADALGVGIIKTFGRWPMVDSKDVWEQKQISRAVETGVGVAREDVRLVRGDGDARFHALIDKASSFARLKVAEGEGG